MDRVSTCLRIPLARFDGTLLGRKSLAVRSLTGILGKEHPANNLHDTPKGLGTAAGITPRTEPDELRNDRRAHVQGVLRR